MDWERSTRSRAGQSVVWERLFQTMGTVLLAVTHDRARREIVVQEEASIRLRSVVDGDEFASTVSAIGDQRRRNRLEFELTREANDSPLQLVATAAAENGCVVRRDPSRRQDPDEAASTATPRLRS
jgi:hypothetical protein